MALRYCRRWRCMRRLRSRVAGSASPSASLLLRAISRILSSVLVSYDFMSNPALRDTCSTPFPVSSLSPPVCLSPSTAVLWLSSLVVRVGCVGCASCRMTASFSLCMRACLRLPLATLPRRLSTSASLLSLLEPLSHQSHPDVLVVRLPLLLLPLASAVVVRRSLAVVVEAARMRAAVCRTARPPAGCLGSCRDGGGEPCLRYWRDMSAATDDEPREPAGSRRRYRSSSSNSRSADDRSHAEAAQGLSHARAAATHSKTLLPHGTVVSLPAAKLPFGG